MPSPARRYRLRGRPPDVERAPDVAKPKVDVGLRIDVTSSYDALPVEEEWYQYVGDMRSSLRTDTSSVPYTILTDARSLERRRDEETIHEYVRRVAPEYTLILRSELQRLTLLDRVRLQERGAEGEQGWRGQEEARRQAERQAAPPQRVPIPVEPLPSSPEFLQNNSLYASVKNSFLDHRIINGPSEHAWVRDNINPPTSVSINGHTYVRWVFLSPNDGDFACVFALIGTSRSDVDYIVHRKLREGPR